MFNLSQIDHKLDLKRLVVNQPYQNNFIGRFYNQILSLTSVFILCHSAALGGPEAGILTSTADATRR